MWTHKVWRSSRASAKIQNAMFARIWERNRSGFKLETHAWAVSENNLLLFFIFLPFTYWSPTLIAWRRQKWTLAQWRENYRPALLLLSNRWHCCFTNGVRPAARSRGTTTEPCWFGFPFSPTIVHRMGQSWGAPIFIFSGALRIWEDMWLMSRFSCRTLVNDKKYATLSLRFLWRHWEGMLCFLSLVLWVTTLAMSHTTNLPINSVQHKLKQLALKVCGFHT